MLKIKFEWDSHKGRINLRKHKVSFSEAATVFIDENGLLLADNDHTENEDRFVLLGLSGFLRLLVVSHCYRQESGIIRIISARKATRTERIQYAKRYL